MSTPEGITMRAVAAQYWLLRLYHRRKPDDPQWCADLKQARHWLRKALDV